MSNDEVNVHNSELSAWLDEKRFKEKAGKISLRFVVDADGVTVLETTDLTSGKKTTSQVLSRESSVYMAVTLARPIAKGK